MAAPLIRAVAQPGPAATAPRLAVVGFMGAGKTTLARLGADTLAVPALDVDEEVERRAGRPVSVIFAQDGEPAFRALEERVALELLAGPGPIVALGGGAVSSAAVRAALRERVVVWLDADADLAWGRCEGTGRPLAADRARFGALHAEREPLYRAVADVVLPAERPPDILALLTGLQGMPAGTRLLWATSRSGDYPAYIGAGLLGAGFWPSAVTGRRFLITDGNVARHYPEAGRPLAGRVTIMPGEQSKTVAHAEIVWTELARAGLTREDVVVAHGGGVVGDLAGFCAATYQRGVRYVQVPTTLVAQVDSAYGGKTGIDLEEAKNYVGAFHLPSAVLADPDVLATLPAAELAAGYAEVVKTALVAGGELWEQVRAGADPTDPAMVSACALAKLRIVARDERDGGLRQVLNLGHTVGHAIETVTGYSAYRHGEAVALGLLVALRLSGQPALREEVRELMVSRGLPDRLEHADPAAVSLATRRDKKRLGEGPVPFVLLDAPGRPRPGATVNEHDLVSAVRELARP